MRALILSISLICLLIGKTVIALWFGGIWIMGGLSGEWNPIFWFLLAPFTLILSTIGALFIWPTWIIIAWQAIWGIIFVTTANKNCEKTS